MQKIAAAFLSGILLFCSFPPLEYYAFAWIALIPLIYLCFCSKAGESILYGLLAGAVFWLASIFWLTRVSFIGWFFISFYCAGYFAGFTLIVSGWRDLMCRNRNLGRAGQPVPPFGSVGQGCPTLPSTVAPMCAARSWPDLILLLGVPAIWVGLEYVRATFLTGFPWNLLGVSQYKNINLIQCADWGGVYLVSYLIVMGNTAFALWIYNCREAIAIHGNLSKVTRRHPERSEGSPSASTTFDRAANVIEIPRNARNDRPLTGGFIYHSVFKASVILALFFLIIFLVLEYGEWRLSRSSEQLETIRVAAVQLNVPQQYKWSDDWANDIYRRLKKSTAMVCRTAPPDLIVWPETALPDFMRYSKASREAVNETRRHGIPLLVGSMDYEIRPGATNYFNSSFLFLPGELKAQVYEKRHLVLFGEYVPLARYFPFLRSISGIEEDFMPGTENIVFRLNNGEKKFSVLICFEDILPYLARECVRAGARLLINQTNDAWFDPSWASRQHMAHCVFRCVENRVACLRATNTGLTCYIDRFGLIRSSLEPLAFAKEPRALHGEEPPSLQGSYGESRWRGDPPKLWVRGAKEGGATASSAKEAPSFGRGASLGTDPREPQVMESEAEFSPGNMPLAFYTRHGDLFALACAAFPLPLFLWTLLNYCNRNKTKQCYR